MKVYVARRHMPSRIVNVWIELDGKRKILPDYSWIINYTPHGFDFGFDGPGPMQLSLAILMDHLNDKSKAIAMHKQFMKDIVSRFNSDNMEIREEDIESWKNKVHIYR